MSLQRTILAGNVSSGIEPVFLHNYERKVLGLDGTHKAAQEFIDSAISKTEMSFEDFKDVYLQAYKLGLKGGTT